MNIIDLDHISSLKYAVGCYVKRDESRCEVWKYEGEWMNGQRHGNDRISIHIASNFTEKPQKNAQFRGIEIHGIRLQIETRTHLG